MLEEAILLFSGSSVSPPTSRYRHLARGRRSSGQHEHLVNGLKKLEEVHNTVAKLQSTAGEKQVRRPGTP